VDQLTVSVRLDVVSDIFNMVAYHWHRTRVIELIQTIYRDKISTLCMQIFWRMAVQHVWIFFVLSMANGLRWLTSWNAEEIHQFQSVTLIRTLLFNYTYSAAVSTKILYIGCIKI